MLDIKFLRENPDIVKENIKKKFQDSKLPLVDEVIKLDAQSRAAKQQADDLRANRNKISKEIGKLMAQGKDVTVILGFNTKSEIFYEEEFKALGCKVIVATADGSYGVKGFATTPLNEIDYTYFYTCGPEPMLKAVYKATNTSGQMSFEERMGCGFGACMGCS